MNEHKPRIFLCHASDDKPRLRELYQQLKAAGYHPWLDEEDLLPGQDWWAEIKKVISDPHNLVVVCLSCNSITKRGTVQREIKRALDVLDEMPEGAVYLIPARLEDCQAPDRLSDLHWVNLFASGGFGKLKQALDFELGKRQAKGSPPPITSTRQPFEPELILIPPGEFLMGSNPKKYEGAYDDEQPQHSLYLPDYYMAKTPATNAHYLAFVQSTSHSRPDHWKDGKPPGDKEDHPVVNVSWYEAMDYCEWLAKVTGRTYRLPSEAEWEKAARGRDGRIYPWGDDPPDRGRCNFEHNVVDTTAVGQYSPQGDSLYGCVDMAGNVWEWTLSLWGTERDKSDFKYPYDPADGREEIEASGDILRVQRGGSFVNSPKYVRCSFRRRNFPNYWRHHVGFRVCVAPLQD